MPADEGVERVRRALEAEDVLVRPAVEGLCANLQRLAPPHPADDAGRLSPGRQYVLIRDELLGHVVPVGPPAVPLPVGARRAVAGAVRAGQVLHDAKDHDPATARAAHADAQLAELAGRSDDAALDDPLRDRRIR